jgi:hypothetical protein
VMHKQGLATTPCCITLPSKESLFVNTAPGQ